MKALNFPIIDTHVHFWDPKHLRYPWLATNSSLNRAFTPPDFEAAIAPLKIDKFVFVQCESMPEDSLAETSWVTSLAQTETRIQGIVAWAPMEHLVEARR